MATSLQGNTMWAAEAGEDLSSALFTFAKWGTDGKLYQSNEGEVVIGVITETATAGNPVTVQMDGVAKITLAASLNAGDRVMSDDNGAAIAAIESPADYYMGGILIVGGVAGDVVSVQLTPGARA